MIAIKQRVSELLEKLKLPYLGNHLRFLSADACNELLGVLVDYSSIKEKMQKDVEFKERNHSKHPSDSQF